MRDLNTKLEQEAGSAQHTVRMSGAQKSTWTMEMGIIKERVMELEGEFQAEVSRRTLSEAKEKEVC